jgi:protein TonB
MQPETILKSDVLDILFENRNKAYGAYTLRRGYDVRMIKAMLITFATAALLLFLFSFKMAEKRTPAFIITDFFPVRPLSNPPKKKSEIPQSAKSIFPKKAAKPVAAIAQPAKTVIVTDDKVNKAIPKVDDTKNKNFSDAKSDGDENKTAQNVVATPGTGGDGKQKGNGLTTTTDPAMPMANPDVYPQFPGGITALQKFLEKNLHKPDDAEDGKSADVKIRFVVNEDGTITGFDVMESGGDEFDKEVLRVLKKMPRWIPGKSNGRNVSVYFLVPVKFVNED